MSTPKRGRWQRRPPKLKGREQGWVLAQGWKRPYLTAHVAEYRMHKLLFWSIPITPPKPPRKAKP